MFHSRFERVEEELVRSSELRGADPFCCLARPRETQPVATGNKRISRVPSEMLEPRGGLRLGVRIGGAPLQSDFPAKAPDQRSPTIAGSVRRTPHGWREDGEVYEGGRLARGPQGPLSVVPSGSSAPPESQAGRLVEGESQAEARKRLNIQQEAVAL